jgi:hypothetical protein
MVFNATLYNITVISWWSVLLVGKSEYPEKTTDMSQVTDKLFFKYFIEYISPLAGFELTN